MPSTVESESLPAIIDIPFFKNRLSGVYQSNSNADNKESPYEMMIESTASHAWIILLVCLDFILNQILLFSVLYNGIPDQMFINTFNSQSPAIWVSMAALSLVMNVIFIFELLWRLYSWGPIDYFKDFWNIFDAILILATIPLKLSLSSKLSVITSIIILFRLWRIGRFYGYLGETERREFDSTILKIVREKDNLLSMETRKANQLEVLLSNANSKLEKLLGERPIEKHIKLF